MSGKEKFHGLGRSDTAGQKRNQQVLNWEKSLTNKEPTHVSSKRKRPRVHFGESVVFLAASQSGDLQEVDRLLSEEGADVNSINKDGLTALHQCCIDDDFEMVQLLVRRGASLNVHDNEGWTPLHAAASCGHDHIVSYLLDHGAFPAPVNNEGDAPEDLADDDIIRDLITAAIEKHGVNVSDAKCEEESMMLADANRLKNDPSLSPAVSPGGATMLHVVSAKNYLQVMEVLLSLPGIANDVDCRDDDGWTPLHAAVYWEHMEAATKLVNKGASVNVVTKTGDTIDDLCRPEYDDKLEELKQLSESTSRDRCYAMNRKRPSLPHQNSRDDKPSPTVVRRRSSRERSMFPKMDIASEKAIIENWTPDEIADGTRSLVGGEGGVVSSSGDIDVFEEPKNNAEQLEEAHTENNVKETVNSLKEREMVAEETNHVSMPTTKPPLPPGTSPQSSPRIQPRMEQSQSNSKTSSPWPSPQVSPKTAKRRPMSGKMLKRVHLWEQQSSTTNLNPPAASPSGSLSPSPQDTPQDTPQSTPQSTPQGTPQSTPQGTPQGTPRGTPQATPQLTRAGAGGETKRFPFVPKTVSQDQGESKLKPLPNRSAKRNSYDETRLAGSLRPGGDSGGYRTNSLPRDARITLPPEPPRTTPQTTPPTHSTAEKSAMINDGGKRFDAEVTVTTTEAMPTQSVPTEGDVSRGGEGARESGRDLSRAESVDSSRSDRSFTEESETNRKRRAKKSRETRKKTQPVPSDLLDQLSQHEAKEIANREGGKAESGDVVKEEVVKEDVVKEEVVKEDVVKEEVVKEDVVKEEVVKEEVVKEEVERERQEFVLQLTTDRQHTQPATAKESPPKQSAYRPNVRPPPRFRPPGATPSQNMLWGLPSGDDSAQAVAAPAGTSTPPHIQPDKDVDSGEGRDGEEEGSGKLHPRTKSAVRRKPREQRKSTGIVQFDADSAELKNAPEEVARLFRKSGSSSASSPDPSPDALAVLRQEMKDVQHSFSLANEEIASLKGKVSELSRRLEDATRAYQQERREKEEKSERISKLEEEAKSKNELKVENQRLKDENSALIRVIGKLSRAPIRPA